MSRHFIKSSVVVSILTLFSRVLGFVRDMMIARIFGADSGTDAFFVVFGVPNFFRRLFGEGAFAQAIVPAMTHIKYTGNQQDLKSFINKLGGTFTLIILLGTLIGIAAAPFLIMFLAPGFIGESQQYESSVFMLRVCIPYLFFISSVAFAGSILNTHGRFAVPAATPVILNLCMIAATVWLAPVLSDPIHSLAWAVLMAGIVQLLFQVPFLVKLQLMPRLQWGGNDPEVWQVIRKMGPALFSVSVTQINLLLSSLIASFLAAGSVSWLYYSERLVEFPLGVLGVALATVILPGLSQDHIKEDKQAFSLALDRGIRLVLVLGLPATLGLIILAEPLLATLFLYDEFTVVDVRMAAQSLVAYTVGLTAFMLIKILVSGFTARKDVKTPLRYGVYTLITNFLLSLGLGFFWAHSGLALATSLAALMNALLLLSQLIKQKVYMPAKGWLVFMIRVLFANTCMASVMFFGVNPEAWFTHSGSDRALDLLIWVLAGIVLYILALIGSGVRGDHLLMTKKALMLPGQEK